MQNVFVGQEIEELLLWARSEATHREMLLANVVAATSFLETMPSKMIDGQESTLQLCAFGRWHHSTLCLFQRDPLESSAFRAGKPV